MALTGKKRAFADAKLAGLSNKDAAIAAGYSPKTASAAGSRLVKDPAVEKYVADQTDAIRNRAEKKPGVATPPGATPSAATRSAFDLEALTHYSDPKAFLKAVMNEPKCDMKQRVEAAKTLMPFEHQKKGDVGKKDQKQAEAEKVASRFGQAAPPRLAATGGKKV